MSTTTLEREAPIMTESELENVDLSSLEFADDLPSGAGRTVYTHNVIVNEFAEGYHVHYNRPSQERWNFYPMVVLMRSGQPLAIRGTKEPAGTVTFQYKPEPKDKIVFVIQARHPRTGRHELLPLVIWERS